MGVPIWRVTLFYPYTHTTASTLRVAWTKEAALQKEFDLLPPCVRGDPEYEPQVIGVDLAEMYEGDVTWLYEQP